VIEHFLQGEAVRIVVIGDRAWQIKLEGDGWLKSIHHENATFMQLDTELLDDTLTLKRAFGLDIIANDYIVTDEGSKHLLEVNHIPNVTRFPDIWDAYREYVVDWVRHS
jgi:glutathione synthase/RimK-type ligase-like ATP-grasp enzyme